LSNAWLLLLPACVGVLGLDDYNDAVAGLCLCDQQVPTFGGRCVEVLGERLDAVSEPTRAAWLSYYAEHCGDSCSDALSCYQQKATCSELGCGEARECCGYSEAPGASMTCDTSQGDGTCVACNSDPNSCGANCCPLP
jgi:hypothetical protein